jgi:hypothetical protein
MPQCRQNPMLVFFCFEKKAEGKHSLGATLARELPCFGFSVAE